MTLAQLFDLADARSGYVRTAKPQLVWSAITAAARSMYLWIKKENSGFFIKWDTTTIAIIAGTDEYSCPPDLDQIVRFSERLNAQDTYREILPTGINTPLFKQNQFDNIISITGGQTSSFSYIGPYSPGTAGVDGQQDIEEAAVEAEVYRVRLAPKPTDVRQTEVVYSAKFIEMTKKEDVCVIPPDGRDALLDYAVAELLRGKNDALAEKLEGSGDKKRELYLTSVRDRQIQQYATIEPYIDDLS